MADEQISAFMESMTTGQYFDSAKSLNDPVFQHFLNRGSGGLEFTEIEFRVSAKIAIIRRGVA